MRNLRHVVAALASVAVLGAVMVPTSRAASEADPIVLGAYAARRNGQTEQQALEALEAAVGRPMAATRVFALWDDPFPTAYHSWLRASDHLVLLSVKPRTRGGTNILWRDIASAQPGSALHTRMVTWARAVRDFGAEVYVSFHAEPEQSAFTVHGGAADFVAAWQRFMGVLREQGATNARLLWIMTDHSFVVGADDRRAAAKWYPGDAWVDAIGADAYNWYTCRGTSNPWKSLEEVVDPVRRFGAAHPDEELWLPEFASTEDLQAPGRKAAWLDDVRALFTRPEYAQFAGIVYFHNTHSQVGSDCRWWIDSSPSALQAFSRMAADPAYGGQGGGGPGPGGRRAALVVADPASLSGDGLLRDRLAALGFTVDVVDADTLSPTALTGASVVVVSATASSAAVGAALRQHGAPLVTWKPSALEAWGMAVPGSATSVTVDSMRIVDPGSALAAGLSGTVRLAARTTRVPSAVPTGSADRVGDVGGAAGLFAVPSGAALEGGGHAPACRVVVPGWVDSFPRFTEEAWQIVTGAVAWASGGCADP